MTEVLIFKPLPDFSKAENNQEWRSSLEFPKSIYISKENLKQGMQEFIDVISYSMISIENKINNFEIDEIELNCGITASGKISILGSGVELSSNGSIKFKFKKVRKQQPSKN